MRVGQAFSKVLDPSKDPLFSDLGDVGLLPEEAWHRDCLPAAVNQQGPSKSAAAIAAEPADTARCVSCASHHASRSETVQNQRFGGTM